MSNELKVLTKVKNINNDCTYDFYVNELNEKKCFNEGETLCVGCIFEGGYQTETNKRLQELIPIIFKD